MLIAKPLPKLPKGRPWEDQAAELNLHIPPILAHRSPSCEDLGERPPEHDAGL